MKRLGIKPLLVALAVFVTAGIALAFWLSATGTGSGSGTIASFTAPVVTVPPSSTGSHTVSWTAAAITGNPADASEITYDVKRRLVGSTTFGPAGGGCAPTHNAATLSCTDTVATSGGYEYQVVATFRSWTATSATAGPVVVVIPPAGDLTAPTVSSIVRAGPSPTNANSVDFTVTFSENVNNVDTADFATAEADGLTGSSVTSVTPNAGPEDVYTVSVNTGSGNGTVGLNLTDNDTIQDGAGNRLGGLGAGNGNFTGETYVVDKTHPTVQSINRAEGETTNASTVTWTVTFSEAVSDVTAADFALVQEDGLTGALIANVAPTPGPAPASTWTVTASTGTGNGKLGLNLVDDDSIKDLATNKLGGEGTGNGNFTGQKYIVDRTGPAVEDMVRLSANPTTQTSVTWRVIFSESSTGVDTNGADFDLVPSGGVTGASITSVTPVDGKTFDVLVNTGTGDGTLGLDLDDDDTIKDQAGNPLGGAGTTGAGDGSFVGPVYTIDRTAPTAQTITRVGPILTNAATVSWTVTFSENVSDVEVEDFDLVASGLTGSSITSVTPNSGPEDVYTVAATAGTGTGTLGLDLDDDDSITDAATNPLGGAGISGAGDGSKVGEVFNIDTDKPNSAVGTVDNITSGFTFTVPYTANDNPNPVSGLAKVELYVDGPSAGTNYVLADTHNDPGASGSFSYTTAAGDGTYTFYTLAYDDAGNQEATPAADAVSATKTTPPTFRMATGTYTGTGVDNRTIAGLGFAPDVVIVKAATAQIAQIRTSTMAGDVSKPMTGGVALTGSSDLIQSLTSDGFTLGASAPVNSSGVSYSWIAFRSGNNVLKVDKYTGTGVANTQQVPATFQPEYVAVFPAAGADAAARTPYQRYAGMLSSFPFGTGAAGANRINSLDAAGGFTAGTSANAIGVEYHYVMFNEVAGAVDVGDYDGDNDAGESVPTTPNFQPDYVSLRGDANDSGHHRPASLSGSSSLYYTATNNTTDGITALTPTGFNVGGIDEVNKNNVNHYFLALKNTAGGSSQFSTLSGANAGDSWFKQTGSSPEGNGDLKVTSKTNDNARAVVKFNLPTAPGGFTLKHSGLYLRDTAAASGRTIQAFGAEDSWDESTVTWANQPDPIGTAAEATTVNSDGYLGWSVTSLVNAMYPPGSNFGFTLRDKNEGDAGGPEQVFTSEEGSAGLRPVLDVTFGN